MATCDLCMLLIISQIHWKQPFPYIAIMYTFQDTFIFKSGIDLYIFCKRRGVFFFSMIRAQAYYTAAAC
jgi:hypothetical protein